MDLDAVEGDGQAAAEAFEGGQGALRAQGVEALGEELGEEVGVEAIKEVANLVVTGDGLHAEEGVTVEAAGLFLQAALEVEEGGGLEEEGSEGAGGGIGDGIALVGAAAGIREGGGGLAEVVQEGIENAGHILCSEAALAKLSPQKRLLFPVPTMTANS